MALHHVFCDLQSQHASVSWAPGGLLVLVSVACVYCANTDVCVAGMIMHAVDMQTHADVAPTLIMHAVDMQTHANVAQTLNVVDSLARTIMHIHFQN